MMEGLSGRNVMEEIYPCFRRRLAGFAYLRGSIFRIRAKSYTNVISFFVHSWTSLFLFCV